MRNVARFASVAATLALALTAGCATEAGSSTAGGGGGGKADDSTSSIDGAYIRQTFDAGKLVSEELVVLDQASNGTFAFQYAGGSALWEGLREIWKDQIVFDGGVAEIQLAADCPVIAAQEGNKLELMQAGSCAGLVPATVSLDGTYRKDLVNAEKLHYARDNGNLTMTWAEGGRVEVNIGGRSGTRVASGAGFVPRVNVMSAMVFKLADDCSVSIVFTGSNEATDTVDITQTGTCDSVGATGALNFDGAWTLVERT